VATPYHAFVPSFGEWGFVVASREPFTVPTRYPQGLRFLDPAGVPGWFHFPPDMAPEPVEINRLDNQSLVRYYDSEWARAEL
jgi:spermidine synthase